MGNKRQIKCLFGYHDWVYRDTGSYWWDKIRRCEHCNKKHPTDTIVFSRLWDTYKKGGVR